MKPATAVMLSYVGVLHMHWLLRPGCCLTEFGIFRVCLQSCEQWQLSHVCLSVCPHRTTWLLLKGFVWNFILVDLLKFLEKIQVWFKSDETW